MALLKGNVGWRSSKSTDNVVNCLTVGLYDHDGAVLGCGKSTSAKTSSTASKKFISFYFENSATSGTSVGDYCRLKVTGAGGSGVAGRFYTYGNVAAALLVGAQISAETGTAGTVSGLMVGCRSQVTLAENATSTPTGTIAGGQSELYFNGSGSSTTDITTATKHSIHRFIVDGDATAYAKVQNAFEFVNVTVGTSSATALVNTTALTASHNMRVIINGDVYGILLDKY